MNFGELLKDCESEIEAHLLRALYPEFGPASRDDLRSQHIIDYYNMPVTIPDLCKRGAFFLDDVPENVRFLCETNAPGAIRHAPLWRLQ